MFLCRPRPTTARLPFSRSNGAVDIWCLAELLCRQQRCRNRPADRPSGMLCHRERHHQQNMHIAHVHTVYNRNRMEEYAIEQADLRLAQSDCL